MKKVCYHLTELQIEHLKELSGKTGLSVAEIIRRSIDSYPNLLDSQVKHKSTGNTGRSGSLLYVRVKWEGIEEIGYVPANQIEGNNE